MRCPVTHFQNADQLHKLHHQLWWVVVVGRAPSESCLATPGKGTRQPVAHTRVISPDPALPARPALPCSAVLPLTLHHPGGPVLSQLGGEEGCGLNRAAKCRVGAHARLQASNLHAQQCRTPRSMRAVHALLTHSLTLCLCRASSHASGGGCRRRQADNEPAGRLPALQRHGELPLASASGPGRVPLPLPLVPA